MGRPLAYTEAEFGEIVALWDEIETWGDERRRARWGKAPTSASMVHDVAEERGLRLASTGKPWSYTLAIVALKRAGKLPTAPSDRAGTRPPGEQRKPAASSQGPKSPDALFAFLEKDLGAFLRPEDRERAAKRADNAAARKIQELTLDLAAKSETRARLDMYIQVYDRLINRLTHRIDTIRDRGVDPEDEARAAALEDAGEDAEAVGAHESVPTITRVARTAKRGR
jgi:hypothetical protein